MAGLDTLGKSRADLQKEARLQQATMQPQPVGIGFVNPEGLSRSGMRNYNEALSMGGLNAVGELNRSGQRRLARTEERVARDYERGLARGQRKQDQSFISQTNATVGQTTTPQPAAATESPATVLKDVYTRSVRSPFTETAPVSGMPDDDFDPFN